MHVLQYYPDTSTNGSTFPGVNYPGTAIPSVFFYQYDDYDYLNSSSNKK
jgi:hypothetical protein